MGDGLLTASKRSNYTFIILYLYHEVDVDYLVANEMVNISKLFYYTCMISIGYKPIMITTQIWLNLLKVIKVNCCRLESLSFETFACLEV
jgi:hypothetical protein